MSVFSAAEISYLQSQRLARIATAGPNGQPHVVPLAFRYNPDMDTIDVGGHDFAKRKKYRDVQSNPARGDCDRRPGVDRPVAAADDRGAR